MYLFYLFTRLIYLRTYFISYLFIYLFSYLLTRLIYLRT